MKTVFFLLSIFSLQSFAIDQTTEVIVPASGTFNVGTINRIAEDGSIGPAKIGLNITRTHKSASKVKVTGQFNYYATKCVQFADEGWIGECAIYARRQDKNGNDKIATKKFTVNVDMSKAASLNEGETEFYYVEVHPVKPELKSERETKKVALSTNEENVTVMSEKNELSIVDDNEIRISAIR